MSAGWFVLRFRLSSVTRTPLCTVKVCPFPTDPWAHVCAVCEAPAVEHHHKIPKGMGGSKARDVKENIIMLCHTHHEQAHGIQEERNDGKRLASSGGTNLDGSRNGDGAPFMGGAQEGVAATLVGASSDGEQESRVGQPAGEEPSGYQPSSPSPGALDGTPEPTLDAGRTSREFGPTLPSVRGLRPSVPSGLGATHG